MIFVTAAPTLQGDIHEKMDCELCSYHGNYVQLSAGVTVAGGADAIYLQNQHGVVIKLTANAIGLRFNLAAGGVNLALKS